MNIGVSLSRKWGSNWLNSSWMRSNAIRREKKNLQTTTIPSYVNIRDADPELEPPDVKVREASCMRPMSGNEAAMRPWEAGLLEVQGERPGC